MKRYIRTIDGKIIDLPYLIENKKCEIKGENILFRHNYIELGYFNRWILEPKHIVKQSDTIKEVINDGDLVKFCGLIVQVEVTDYGCLFIQYGGKDYDLFDVFDEVTELYTKQNRNYVLVWTSEEGVI